MKRVVVAGVCLCLLALCACGQGETLEEILTTALFTTEMITTTIAPIIAVFDPGDVAPYADELERIIREYVNSDFMHYTVYDIDGNGTPELLLGVNDYHNNIFIHDIFTINNGIAVQLGIDFEYDGSPMPGFLFGNGVIRSDFDYVYQEYYRIVDGKREWQAQLDPYRTTKIIPVTKDEFIQAQKEIEGEGETIKLDWKPWKEYENRPGPEYDAIAGYVEYDVSRESALDRVEYYYAFWDIDGNGVDELLLDRKVLGCLNGTDDVHFYACYAAAENGFAVRQHIGDSTEPLLILNNGTIKMISKNYHGGLRYDYYRGESGEFRQITLWENGPYRSYYTKTISLTKDEFEYAQKEIEGNGQTIVLDWKPLVEYGR